MLTAIIILAIIATVAIVTTVNAIISEACSQQKN